MNRRDFASGALASVVLKGLCRQHPAHAATRYRVVCFTGWVIPIVDSVRNSPVQEVVDRLARRGVRADLRAPEYWESTLAEIRAAPVQVTLVGYSLGAASAINVANGLANSRAPVRSLVLLEASNPPAITVSTRVTHFYATGSNARVTAGPGFKGAIRNIDVGRIDSTLSVEGHLSVARVEKILDLITRTVLGGS